MGWISLLVTGVQSRSHFNRTGVVQMNIRKKRIKNRADHPAKQALFSCQIVFCLSVNVSFTSELKPPLFAEVKS